LFSSGISHLFTRIHPLLPLLPTAAGLHSGKHILILVLVVILDYERLELSASILLLIILVLVIFVLVVVLEENKPYLKGVGHDIFSFKVFFMNEFPPGP
jgi:hypothetical protein